MTIYWSTNQVPELNGLTREERGRVHGACYGQAFRSLRCMIALLICGLCGGLGTALGGSLHWLFGFPPSIWHLFIGGVVGGGIGGFIYGQVLIDYLRPLYAEYIRTELRPDKDAR